MQISALPSFIGEYSSFLEYLPINEDNAEICMAFQIAFFLSIKNDEKTLEQIK